LGVEEKSEVVEDVIKQVVNYNTSFDTSRERIYELIVFLHLA